MSLAKVRLSVARMSYSQLVEQKTTRIFPDKYLKCAKRTTKVSEKKKFQTHILSPLTEADSDPKSRKLICNYAQEDSFTELECMVSDETLLSYPYLTIPFMVHTDVSDKQLGAAISQNNKPIELF